ncbi:hypothetical protein CTKA_00240 [Chthonomonas calidirosea]|uniref:GYF domain-containing protein n=1 Tax=Chthonomonas calidirosea (strain DSM 23976 / ICMP 18418 / T49) TaxID=1303518 RepID=S0EU10_CHTCT|nr:hypothetical protein [Chthonomonas calidirosea]CCW34742.1 hypothetical protein CCALI_00919 [Chthonomonas calidirosea T49]CEK13924.1 hypothetical protein CTKA_00240 [Chthonomonas calidirosea]
MSQQYYVLAQDGHRYGPVDVTILQRWVQESRVIPATILEEAQTGRRLEAAFLPELHFPSFMPAPPQLSAGISQPPMPAYYNPQLYPNQPYYYPQTVPGSGDAIGWIIGSVVCMFISLFFFPIVFGPVAILCGYKVKQSGNGRLGTGLMVAASVCMFLGILIGILAWSVFMAAFGGHIPSMGTPSDSTGVPTPPKWFTNSVN